MWAADPRLHDRPLLDLDPFDELVVIAAHPDDETLGAGGLMAECAKRGIPVRLIVATDGAASHAEQPGLPGRRSLEVAEATGILAPLARIHELGFADGQTLENRAEVRDALVYALGNCSPHALIVAPWRGDGHRDHRVVGEIVAELMDDVLAGLTFVEYPIWMWHWATPESPDVPWDDIVAVPVDAATKSRALHAFASQIEGDPPVLRADFLANFDRDTELFVASRDRELGQRYFDATYERHDDPWGFETRWYEERKRALTLAALPDERYLTALELGCSIGVLTADLAERCDDLLAIDVSQAAVDRTRARVGDRARVERADLLVAFPEGAFDLIVLSEVGYYFSLPELDRVLTAIGASLAPGGTIVACHWRHPVDDYPLSGDQVHARLRRLDLARLSSHLEEDFVLEVFSRDGSSVARRTGLL